MIRCMLGKIMWERKLTNAEVADMAGVSRNTISSLVNEKNQRIDYPTLDRLCKALNITVCELIQYFPEE